MAQHQRKPGQRRSADGSSTFKWVLIGIVALGVLGIGYSIWNSQVGGAATAPVSLDTLDARAIAEQAEPVRKGDPNAPVQIVEFADYQCPGCAHFATNVARPIRAAYADQGDVHFVYYDFPLPGHPHSFLAARAARCAGEQERYWEMHDILYARQLEWSPSRNPPIDRFVEYARAVGVDADEFESCLRSDRFADVVTANAMVGEQLGVNSTPTVFLNGRGVGDAWDDLDQMRQLIESQLEAERSLRGPEAAPAGATTPTDTAAR